jgi:NADPH:quinone reductase-like Zn-dependent oxidoreductase
MKIVEVRAPGGIDRLEVSERADPAPPGPGEILLRVRASSINYHDYYLVTNPSTPDHRIPMIEGAGEVVAVGEGVGEFKSGDAVFSIFARDWLDGDRHVGDMDDVPGDGFDGHACELMVAPASSFTREPRGYSHRETATLMAAGLTAWRALVPNGQLKAGQVVLVQGTGGVSIFALQFAKAMGATVIATSSSDAKLERLKALGADHLINYRQVEKWGSLAYDLSDGGVDHIIDIGGAGTLPESLAAVRYNGHIAMIGVLAGYEGPVPTALFIAKQARVQGLTAGSRQQQREMVRAIETTGIRPVIDSCFPLEGLADALRYQETGAHFGKICIDI